MLNDFMSRHCTRRCRHLSHFPLQPTIVGIVYFNMHEELWLGKKHHLHTIPNLGKEWSVKFDLKSQLDTVPKGKSIITIIDGTYKEVISIYTNRKDDKTTLSITVPPASFGVEKLNILPTSPLTLDEWTPVKITHRLEDGKYTYKVFINDFMKAELENKHVQKFDNVKVFSAHPWRRIIRGADSGFIRNIIIKAGNFNYFIIDLNFKDICFPPWFNLAGHCFYFVYEQLTWLQARDWCSKHSGHLAIIDTQRKQDVLAREMRSRSDIRKLFASSFWIGLTDEALEGTWAWQRTGMITNFTAWAASRPVHSRASNCARMWTGGLWYDEDCQRSRDIARKGRRAGKGRINRIGGLCEKRPAKISELTTSIFEGMIRLSVLCVFVFFYRERTIFLSFLFIWLSCLYFRKQWSDGQPFHKL